jgi:hypothetical protein
MGDGGCVPQKANVNMIFTGGQGMLTELTAYGWGVVIAVAVIYFIVRLASVLIGAHNNKEK